ncbi:MAG TPA: cation-translocating P-type ATPase, partial [Leptospiraceae bacterium]|nr:cation-translocating P-type ATPase [Leptospiraceae bacterium]
MNEPLSKPHALSTDQILELVTSSRTGLSVAEADRRLALWGPNEIPTQKRSSWIRILAQQLKNVLIIILLLATVLSAVLGHSTEAAVIAIIVIFAALLGFIQEFRAEKAMSALKQLSAPTALALRDGEVQKIAARNVVPGDIIHLHAGDRIPADARILESFSLRTEEASLTGESLPVEKETMALAEDAALADRVNMVYSGTSVSYGRGVVVVTNTGLQTEFGKIARMLESVEHARTPLQINLDKVGNALAKAAGAIVVLITILGVMRGQPFLDMILFGIALAVAVVPEALPAVVTVSLALGVQRMIKRNALVRRLPAVETLGSVSVIGSDKTGTLTKDEMTVRKIHLPDQRFDVTGSGYEPSGDFVGNGTSVSPSPELILALKAASLASDASLENKDGSWKITGDPTEGAMIVAAAKAGLDKDSLDNEFPRIHEIPFTSETKRMTTLHSEGTSKTAYSKGAPESILPSCTHYLSQKGILALTDREKSEYLKEAAFLAGEALRVIAVAMKQNANEENAEEGMIFLGLLGMIDPPRTEVKTAIEKCRRAGIKPIMITGDHPITAAAIARELGILRNGKVITGVELDSMSPEEFKRQVESIEVYARVSPAHKLMVVHAFQKNGHSIAMTGDGVNDAPALKKADIGIAMGITGTDVTREAAAMTLTDDNFASIVAAVEEGRGVFGNIKKYLMYLLSSNIGEIGLMAGTSMLGLPLPLSAVQILYVNLATDGLPALALAVDPPDEDAMNQPPRNASAGIFTRPVVVLMLAGGIWSTLVNLGLFAWAQSSGRSLSEAMTMSFASLV